MSNPVVIDWNNESFFLYIAPFLIQKNIVVRGILHIGAHTCEEKKEYNDAGIPDEKIVWIEGNKDLCEKNKQKGIQNMYQALISDTEKEVTFHITNNFASSSLFPLYVHKYYYPDIVEAQTVKDTAISLQTFFTRESLDPRKYNIWVLDIQGGEYDAFQGAGHLLENVDVILTEINFEKMYENIALADTLITFLKSKGFVMTHLKLWRNCWGDAMFVRESYL